MYICTCTYIHTNTYTYIYDLELLSVTPSCRFEQGLPGVANSNSTINKRIIMSDVDA